MWKILFQNTYNKVETLELDFNKKENILVLVLVHFPVLYFQRKEDFFVYSYLVIYDYVNDFLHLWLDFLSFFLFEVNFNNVI